MDHVAPEATYLSRLDFTRTPLDDPARAQHTPVDTCSFARLNFATSKDVLLRQILTRITDVL